jgi:xanthine phosphoribosyltransferase
MSEPVTESVTELVIELSWARIHADAKFLADQLRPLGPWPAMVAVTRGGLIPAGLVAQELGIHCVETLGLQSYSKENEPGNVQVVKALPAGFDCQARVLVMDDLVDTGQSARAIRRLLPHAHIATLYAKPKGLAMVQSHVADFAQDEWIVFPWEQTQHAVASG